MAKRGGFPGGGTMNQIMQQAQKMQRMLEKAQEEAALMTGSAEAGGGMIHVEVNNDHLITKLEIKAEAVDPDDVEMLQDLVTAAVNAAMQDLDAKVEEKMSGVTGGMGPLGGLF